MTERNGSPRTEWWQAKFDRNVANDRNNQAALAELGWNVIVVWECELKDPESTIPKLLDELSLADTQTIRYRIAEGEAPLNDDEKQTKYRTEK